jgi:hypothetical protein
MTWNNIKLANFINIGSKPPTRLSNTYKQPERSAWPLEDRKKLLIKQIDTRDIDNILLKEKVYITP